MPLRFLLAHSGGLPREVPVDMWESKRGPDRTGLLAAFGEVDMVDRPGARWHYSNLGFAVLGQVVEKVTGVACTELIDTLLLAPLGLASTSWVRPPAAAIGYRVDALQPAKWAVLREIDGSPDQGRAPENATPTLGPEDPCGQKAISASGRGTCRAYRW